jgi:hypothetical protein
MRKIIFKKISEIFFVALSFVALLVPHFVGAVVQNNEGGGGNISYALKNPLAFDSIESFVVAILNVVIVIATPIVVLFIIFAGFKYVTARGNPGQIQEATQALTYAIIGGVLIIGAVAISKIIGNLVTAFGA